MWPLVDGPEQIVKINWYKTIYLYVYIKFYSLLIKFNFKNLKQLFQKS